MPNIKYRAAQPPKIPKGHYRTNKSVHKQSKAINSSIVLTQDPQMKSEIVAKSNKSQANSPRSELKQDKSSFRNRLRSIEPHNNASAVKEKQHRKLLSNRRETNSDNASGKRPTSHSSHQMHQTSSKISKLQSLGSQSKPTSTCPEVIVKYRPSEEIQKGYRAHSVATEENKEYEYVDHEEEYDNDDFENPEYK